MISFYSLVVLAILHVGSSKLFLGECDFSNLVPYGVPAAILQMELTPLTASPAGSCLAIRMRASMDSHIDRQMSPGSVA